MKEVQYYRPQSLDEALDILDQLGNSATIMAGATDIMPRVNDGVFKPENLVYIGDIGLDSIGMEDGALRIGATATLTEIEENPLVLEYAPVLAEAVRHMAGVSVRNIATIAGNICNASPAADTATPLLVLDAVVQLRAKKGSREVAIGDFFVGPGKTVLEPGELVCSITIPVCPHSAAYLKLGQRKAEVLSIVGVSAKLKMKDGCCTQVRIALGSVAPRPLRCPKAEALLEGKTPSEALFAQAGALAGEYAKPISDTRASAWYRERMVPVQVKNALMVAAGLEVQYEA